VAFISGHSRRLCRPGITLALSYALTSASWVTQKIQRFRLVDFWDEGHN
jgi:hypothetical protein